ncbi:hypothetical protein DIPPA_05088 [Diplonema papillatum]|nr:hypothetical protein DIPPA_09444 [Diplonema papillatum]KAJ9455008.1 hypothetical protein DIPPA_05088 [Diplonema papillatum]
MPQTVHHSKPFSSKCGGLLRKRMSAAGTASPLPPLSPGETGSKPLPAPLPVPSTHFAQPVSPSDTHDWAFQKDTAVASPRHQPAVPAFPQPGDYSSSDLASLYPQHFAKPPLPADVGHGESPAIFYPREISAQPDGYSRPNIFLEASTHPQDASSGDQWSALPRRQRLAFCQTTEEGTGHGSWPKQSEWYRLGTVAKIAQTQPIIEGTRAGQELEMVASSMANTCNAAVARDYSLCFSSIGRPSASPDDNGLAALGQHHISPLSDRSRSPSRLNTRPPFSTNTMAEVPFPTYSPDHGKSIARTASAPYPMDLVHNPHRAQSNFRTSSTPPVIPPPASLPHAAFEGYPSTSPNRPSPSQAFLRNRASFSPQKQPPPTSPPWSLTRRHDEARRAATQPIANPGIHPFNESPFSMNPYDLAAGEKMRPEKPGDPLLLWTPSANRNLKPGKPSPPPLPTILTGGDAKGTMAGNESAAELAMREKCIAAREELLLRREAVLRDKERVVEGLKAAVEAMHFEEADRRIAEDHPRSLWNGAALAAEQGREVAKLASQLHRERVKSEMLPVVQAELASVQRQLDVATRNCEVYQLKADEMRCLVNRAEEGALELSHRYEARLAEANHEAAKHSAARETALAKVCTEENKAASLKELTEKLLFTLKQCEAEKKAAVRESEVLRDTVARSEQARADEALSLTKYFEEQLQQAGLHGTRDKSAEKSGHLSRKNSVESQTDIRDEIGVDVACSQKEQASLALQVGLLVKTVSRLSTRVGTQKDAIRALSGLLLDESLRQPTSFYPPPNTPCSPKGAGHVNFVSQSRSLSVRDPIGHRKFLPANPSSVTLTERTQPPPNTPMFNEPADTSFSYASFMPPRVPPNFRQQRPGAQSPSFSFETPCATAQATLTPRGAKPAPDPTLPQSHGSASFPAQSNAACIDGNAPIAYNKEDTGPNITASTFAHFAKPPTSVKRATADADTTTKQPLSPESHTAMRPASRPEDSEMQLSSLKLATVSKGGASAVVDQISWARGFDSKPVSFQLQGSCAPLLFEANDSGTTLLDTSLTHKVESETDANLQWTQPRETTPTPSASTGAHAPQRDKMNEGRMESKDIEAKKDAAHTSRVVFDVLPRADLTLEHHGSNLSHRYMTAPPQSRTSWSPITPINSQLHLLPATVASSPEEGFNRVPSAGAGSLPQYPKASKQLQQPNSSASPEPGSQAASTQGIPTGSIVGSTRARSSGVDPFLDVWAHSADRRRKTLPQLPLEQTATLNETVPTVPKDAQQRSHSAQSSPISVASRSSFA